MGFAAGSVPFGLILALLIGKADIRKAGSGNIGAANVARVVGKKLGVFTLVLDAAKGAVPVLCAVHLVQADLSPPGCATVAALVGMSALLGHCFTPWLRFKGGKGVATAIGASFGIHPLLGVATGLTWLIIAYFFRYSSLAALVAAVFTPVYYLLCDGVAWRSEPAVTVTLGLIACLLIWRHSANVGRLIRGTEPRIGTKR